MDFKKEVDVMKKEIENVGTQQKSFYMEILHDYKLANKRIFILCFIEAIIIIGMFIGFLIYNEQFETVIEGETTTIESGNGTATYLENSESGDIIYGTNNQNTV